MIKKSALFASAFLVLAAPNISSAQVTSAEPLAIAGPYAQHNPNPNRAAAIEQGRKMIADFMAERGVPGISVAVSMNGVLLWSEGFGLADVEQGVPVTTATRFRSGSVAKPIGMAAAAVLHDQGKLDFDTPVQKLVPSYPVKSKTTITFRMLAGMQAGLGDYTLGSEEFFRAIRYDNVLDYVATYKDAKLLFEPGTQYRYSTQGTNLQGAMTQAAGGKLFQDLVPELVFAPLGMTNSTPDRGEEIIPNRARGYERTGGEPTTHIRLSSWGKKGAPERGILLNAPFSDNSNKFPGGGMITTPEDLVKFGNAELKPGFLKADTLAQLQTEQRTVDGKPTGYGMNWMIGKDSAGRRTVSHSGSSAGGNSVLILYPDQGLVFAMQSNLTDSGFKGLPRALSSLFLK